MTTNNDDAGPSDAIFKVGNLSGRHQHQLYLDCSTPPRNASKLLPVLEILKSNVVGAVIEIVSTINDTVAINVEWFCLLCLKNKRSTSYCKPFLDKTQAIRTETRYIQKR